jgi:hypothetical protein
LTLTRAVTVTVLPFTMIVEPSRPGSRLARSERSVAAHGRRPGHGRHQYVYGPYMVAICLREEALIATSGRESS